jgi:tetratricopeptide (TPR) repeat protein
MMVYSKLNSDATTPTVALEPGVRSVTLDDFDPHNAARRATAMKPTWARIRLLILLSILIPLALFGFLHNRQTTRKLRIQNALEIRDDKTALRELRLLEERFGPSAETAFLRSRAYRHLGDDNAFNQFSAQALELGYPEERIRNEQLLRDLHLGNVDDMRKSMAIAINSPYAELEELGPAVVNGFLSKLDFAGIAQFLDFWGKEDPASPWIPYFRGMTRMAGRDYQSAIESFERCASANPKFVPVYGPLGTAYIRISDKYKGIKNLRRYLQSVPSDLAAASDLATTLSDLDRDDEVIELLKPFVEARTANNEIIMILSRIYSTREESSKVVDLLSSVAAQWPEDSRVANLLSEAHQALGNEQEAVRYAKIVHDNLPDLESVDERISRILNGVDATPEKQYELGHILLHKQSREEGMYWLRSALALDATYLPAHEDLVVYYDRSNQPKLAERHQRYIDLRRKSP